MFTLAAALGRDCYVQQTRVDWVDQQSPGGRRSAQRGKFDPRFEALPAGESEEGEYGEGAALDGLKQPPHIRTRARGRVSSAPHP